MTFDPRFNDSDPNSNPMTITANTNGSHGTVTILGGGTALSYVATQYIYSELESDQFTYTISDGNGGTATPL